MPYPIELQAPERVLTWEDQHSATWQRLKAYLEKEIDLTRKKNDCDLSAEATATLRGEIKALKKVLALEDNVPDQL